MLYRLEIENFYSVRDLQVLDLTIAPNVTDTEGRFAPLFPGSPLRAPKVIALYGPNASGKTTVLRALDFLFDFVKSSVKRVASGFPVERFNDRESADRPIKLAIELAGIMDVSSERLAQYEGGTDVPWGLYRYELELDVSDGSARRVSNEALRQKPGGKGKWQRVFERDIHGDVKGCASFPINAYRHLLTTMRDNVSVISYFALFQHPTASAIQKALSSVLTNLAWDGTPIDDRQVVDIFANQPNMVATLSDYMQRIDIGVQMMRIENGPNGPFLMFRHKGLEKDMPWALESHGTRAFIRLFPFLLVTLAQGGIAIIDEFDVMIHPLLLPEILSWYYNKAVQNPLDAQLWISCHSASLLDDLTKEEIVFCEKDSNGRTSIYSLMDVKAVRRDDNLYRKYLSGAYGAVPHIG
jgi:AAA15 family ATPase/GTPase